MRSRDYVLVILVGRVSLIFLRFFGQITPGTDVAQKPPPGRHPPRPVAAPMITAAFVPLLVVLILRRLGVNHGRATNIGVITAAALLIGVALPGAYLHGLRVGGWQ
jgi:hypothetical protein